MEITTDTPPDNLMRLAICNGGAALKKDPERGKQV